MNVEKRGERENYSVQNALGKGNGEGTEDETDDVRNPKCRVIRQGDRYDLFRS